MEGAGAAETGEDVVMGVAVGEVVVVITPTPTTPTIIQTIRIGIKIKTKAKIRVNNKRVQKLTKEAPNIRISLPVLAGPVLSTGRKDEGLHTALILWCANGTRSSPPGLQPPETLASLVSFKII